MQLLRHGHPFKIECETVSSHSVTFLECLIEKSVDAFKITPWNKPSNLNTVWLNRFSSHAPSIHSSWPLSRMKARVALCSTRRLRIQEAESFVQRASKQHLASKAIFSIHQLAARMGSQRSRDWISQRGCSHCSQLSKLPKPNNTIVWMVLPFTPAMFSTGLSQRLVRM